MYCSLLLTALFLRSSREGVAEKFPTRRRMRPRPQLHPPAGSKLYFAEGQGGGGAASRCGKGLPWASGGDGRGTRGGERESYLILSFKLNAHRIVAAFCASDGC